MKVKTFYIQFMRSIVYISRDVPAVKQEITRELSF